MSVHARVEAALFASSKPLKLEELCRIAKASEEEVKQALDKIKEELVSRGSSLCLESDEEGWQLSLKHEFQPVLKSLGAKAELPKALIKTLSVVASRAPVLQSEVVKIRTNKAYDELSRLEGLGFIMREKKGRTKLIRLTPKFYEYFQVPEKKLKERLEKAEKKFEEIGIKTFEVKEVEVAAPPLEVVEDKFGELETYEAIPEGAEGKEAAWLAGLEVYEVKKPKPLKEVKTKGVEKPPEPIEHEKKGERLFTKGIPEEVKARIEERVKEIVTGEKKEEKEEVEEGGEE